MANILRDATAPYALVIAIGAFGWLVNSAIEELQTQRLVEYEISYTSDENRVAVVDITNRSRSFALSDVSFHFHCVKDAECFLDDGAELPPIMRTPISGIDRGGSHNWVVAGRIVSADARLAPESAVRYRIPLSDSDATIFPIIQAIGAKEGESIAFREGRSYAGIIISNYFSIVFGVLVLLIFIFIAYLVVIILSSFSSSAVTATKPSQANGKKPGQERAPAK